MIRRSQLREHRRGKEANDAKINNHLIKKRTITVPLQALEELLIHVLQAFVMKMNYGLIVLASLSGRQAYN